ncbi:MAG: flavin reductase family protein [Pseudomonadota bacterium]
MRLEFAALDPKSCYKLLIATVLPRPIAWVTTVSGEGVVNAAPYSFFNVFGEKPALIVLGLQHRADGSPKDTTRNIRASGEFVVNILTPDLAGEMVETAALYPADRSEPEAVGLALAPSLHVAPPRLAAAPVAFECRRLTGLSFSGDRELCIGEALAIEARDGLIDPETLHVDWQGAFPLARLFGPRYGRVEEIAPLTIPEPRAAGPAVRKAAE